MSNNSKIMYVCEIHEETIEHALFNCSHARATLFSSPLVVISLRVPNNGLVEWWRNIILPSDPSTKILDEVKVWTIATWWAIWNAPNDFIFMEKKVFLPKTQ